METNVDEIINIVEDACDTLFELHQAGFELPGYVERNGKPFLMKLLLDQTYDKQSALGDSYFPFWTKIFSPYEKQLKAIAGPHGWTILKILIAQSRGEEEA